MADLRTLPAVRKLATTQAETFYNTWVKRTTFGLTWATINEESRVAHIETHLDLLTDLTRAASRDAVVRLIERLGDARDRVKARDARNDAEALTRIALAVLTETK